MLLLKIHWCQHLAAGDKATELSWRLQPRIATLANLSAQAPRSNLRDGHLHNSDCDGWDFVLLFIIAIIGDASFTSMSHGIQPVSGLLNNSEKLFPWLAVPDSSLSITTPSTDLKCRPRSAL
jgi:hypothetical protein